MKILTAAFGPATGPEGRALSEPEAGLEGEGDLQPRGPLARMFDVALFVRTIGRALGLSEEELKHG